MSISLLLAFNFFIALLWLGLSSAPSPISFFIGFIIGMVLIQIFYVVFDTDESFYSKRIISFILFIIYFLKELIIANIQIAKAVLFSSTQAINPNIIEYDISELSNIEILILTHSISLTPGTTSLGISDNRKTLFVHAFDASRPDDIRSSITKGLLNPIKRFTR